MIEYNINMREEIFGSTLLNLKNGQREYLDKSETKKILEGDYYSQFEEIVKTAIEFIENL